MPLDVQTILTVVSMLNFRKTGNVSTAQAAVVTVQYYFYCLSIGMFEEASYKNESVDNAILWSNFS